MSLMEWFSLFFFWKGQKKTPSLSMLLHFKMHTKEGSIFQDRIILESWWSDRVFWELCWHRTNGRNHYYKAIITTTITTTTTLLLLIITITNSYMHTENIYIYIHNKPIFSVHGYMKQKWSIYFFSLLPAQLFLSFFFQTSSPLWKVLHSALPLHVQHQPALYAMKGPRE